MAQGRVHLHTWPGSLNGQYGQAPTFLDLRHVAKHRSRPVPRFPEPSSEDLGAEASQKVNSKQKPVSCPLGKGRSGPLNKNKYPLRLGSFYHVGILIGCTIFKSLNTLQFRLTGQSISLYHVLPSIMAEELGSIEPCLPGPNACRVFLEE